MPNSFVVLKSLIEKTSPAAPFFSQKMKVGVLITLLVFIIIWIVYRLFSIEGVEDQKQIVVMDPNQAERNAIKRDYEDRKGKYDRCMISEKYQTDKTTYEKCLKDEADAEAARIAEEIRKKAEDDARIEAERIARIEADRVARKKAEDDARKKAEDDARKEADRKQAARKALFDSGFRFAGNAVTGKYTSTGKPTPWGGPSPNSIFSSIRPETLYIWKPGTKDVKPGGYNLFFKYIYKNTTGAPFKAMLNIIADNACEVSNNGKNIQAFSGGWPNGLPSKQIDIYVGDNTFVFKCGNWGGPAGLAVIVTDMNRNLLFNTSDPLIHGWKIIWS